MTILNIFLIVLCIWLICSIITFIAIRRMNPKRKIPIDILVSLGLGPFGIILLMIALAQG